MKRADPALRKPVPIPSELVLHQRNYRFLSDQRGKQMRDWWAEKLRDVTTDWEHTETPCDCYGSSETPHNKVRFRRDGKWYILCPIYYWFLLKRKHEMYDTVETLCLLLEKEMPCQTTSD